MASDEIDQLGASISVEVLERLKRFLGRKLIKNAVVEEAIVEYLDVREKEPHVLRVAIDEDLRKAIGRFHRENIEAPPDAIARHALRLLVDLKSTAREFVVRLHDDRMIEQLTRHCAAKHTRPAAVAREAIGVFLQKSLKSPRGGRA